MCAIFGTKNKEQYDSLYEINHKRGGFAYSVVFKNKDGKFMTTKGRGYIKPLVNSYPYGIKLFIIKTGLFIAQLNHDNPDPRPIKYSAWYK